jgi:hypothetical protein
MALEPLTPGGTADALAHPQRHILSGDRRMQQQLQQQQQHRPSMSATSRTSFSSEHAADTPGAP